MVLGGRSGPRFHRPVDTDSLPVGKMIRSPLRIFVPVHIGTVVVVWIDHPTNTEWRGVIFINFRGFQEHLFNFRDYFFVVTEGLFDPFFGNFFTR